MVPAVYNGKKIIKITSNGITLPYSVKSIKGFNYGMVTIQPGHPHSLTVNYGMP
jgi:hypothetical protein